MFPRRSGILLHPTSLPARFGIGDFGVEAYRFADFLAAAGQHLWQILPLGPIGYGDSPYQSLSAFAGNPLLVDPVQVASLGLLDPATLTQAPRFPDDIVNYDAVAAFKFPILKRSFDVFEDRGDSSLEQAFDAFCKEQAFWLDDYALYMAVREAHKLAAWNTWEVDIRERRPEAVRRWGREVARDVRRHKFQQYLFFRQWSELKKYCNNAGIMLIGDIPIFTAFDSESVWAHTDMFYLDHEGKPTVVAGVPPDYFSRTGQLWNNPLYRWDVLARDGFRWWIERFRAICSLVDIVRVDHFRGFEKYWEIPAGSSSAESGRWVEGPGSELFKVVSGTLGELPLVAEDLGMITPAVHALRDKFGFPGMRVIQFAFLSGSSGDHHLPHNYPRNCVVYTGTHDNNTVIGWFRGEGEQVSTVSAETRARERQMVLRYIGTNGDNINWDMIRLAFMSVADTAIVPLQDVLGLGSEGRMNVPGTSHGNWRWRFSPGQLTEQLSDRLKGLTTAYGR